MKNCYAIVGTDTDAGKTVVTAGLSIALHALGKTVSVLKPVQTGCLPQCAAGCEPVNHEAPDISVVQDACPEARCQAFITLREPCSPHLAARLQNTSLSAEDIAERVKSLKKSHPDDTLLVECAGGLMVPLNERETQRDFLRVLEVPVLLVVPNRLGAINHALLTVEALENAGIETAGFIFSSPNKAATPAGTPDGVWELEQRIREDNLATLLRMTGLPCLAEVPFVGELASPVPDVRKEGWCKTAAALKSAALFLTGGAADKEGGDESGSKNTGLPLPPEELIRYDRGHIWHPYTSALVPLPAREAVATSGTRILLRDGTRLVDGMSSWWCAVHGYNHPSLLRALAVQARTMPHVMFGGLTHEPAVTLARKLLGMAPRGLEHVFFADSGSVAVEAAMKMAVQYQQASGHSEKTAFLTVRGGYHGDTLNAMSVCDPVNGMHSLFTGILPRQLFVPRPECRFDEPYDDASAKAFEQAIEEHSGSVAAVILEPILQGAGGMWMYHPQYLKRVRELCDHFGCLLILDEVATGFGRTGKLFACQWADVSPDIMCVGKALTGGVMSLAAALATRKVAEGVSSGGGVLMHGPTFMGNPLACAVASASLSLLETGAWQEQVAMIERVLREDLAPCGTMQGVADVRVLGAVGVIETQRPVNVEKLQDYFVRNGVWIRPFGRLLYIMPPYVTPRHEVQRLATVMREAVLEGAWE